MSKFNFVDSHCLNHRVTASLRNWTNL